GASWAWEGQNRAAAKQSAATRKQRARSWFERAEGRPTLNASARSWRRPDMGAAPSAYGALTIGTILVSRGAGKSAFHADFPHFMQPLFGVLHVPHGEVVVEVVVEAER